MGEIKREWKDETSVMSNIDNLNFPADRYWQKCKVELEGRHKMQLLHAEVFVDNTKQKELEQDGEGSMKPPYECPLNKICSINISGYLKNKGNLTGADGSVYVTLTYDDNSLLKSKSVEWSDRTAGNSLIDDLFLTDEHKWEKCSVTVDFDKNSDTGCMITLLKNGELAYLPGGNLPAWTESLGSGTKTYTFDINDKAALVVSGYISNKSIGAGAKITLTGYYKE